MSYRYLGNKARIADWIVDIIAALLPSGNTIADLMCGTATVSAALASAGYRVVAGDELRFPVLHAQARLLGGRENFEQFGLTYSEALQQLNALPPQRGFFWREYSDEGRPLNGAKPRGYFTGFNAAQIDAIRTAVRGWRAQGLDNLAADVLIHDLILATNRIANIAGTYGYYRSKWNSSSLEPLHLIESHRVPDGGNHEVIWGAISDTVGQCTYDALYLDPPYTKRQYGGNYHIPETLALGDYPKPAGDGGLRPWREQASDFCYRRRARRAFEGVLDKCKAPLVFISYSDDAHLPGDELLDLCRRYGETCRYEIPLGRYRSNARVAREGAVTEHLYVLEMAHARPAESDRSLVLEAQS